MRRLHAVPALLCAVALLGLAQQLSPWPSIDERRLSPRGLENLTAFGRLYGYVVHFHPSDEVARADLDALAVDGVRAIEGANGPAELARELQDFFRPVAPLLRVFPASEPAPAIDFGSKALMISLRHHGFGGGVVEGVYNSERVIRDAPGGRLPEPFAAALGGGVRALVPMALFVDQNGTLPHTVQGPAAGRTIRYTNKDRAARIAGVIIAWNVFQHFYPYFDVVKTDWPKALETGMRSAASDEHDYGATINRLLAGLKDGRAWGPGPFGTVVFKPLPQWDWIEDRLVITQVPERYKRKIEPGDAVLSINGKPVAKALAEIEDQISGATPQLIRYRAISALDLGRDYLTLKIEPFRKPSARRTVRFKKSLDRKTVLERRPDKISEIKPGIYYVDLSRVDDADWKASIDSLARASGIVFDMRGRYSWSNVKWLGHLSAAPLKSPQWHMPVITEPDRRNMKFERSGEWEIKPALPYLKARRAVLANRKSIGPAETILSIFEHYKLAEIVGEPTGGTNGDENVIILPCGYDLHWTGMKVLKQDGSQFHGIGIRPTIPVARTRAGVAAGRDELLERAILAVQ